MSVPRARPVAATIVGEIGKPSRVIEVGVREEDVANPQLLVKRQRPRDGARLEQDGVVEQQAGKVSRRRRSALTAENPQPHGETIAGEGIKAR